ncbi:leukocyte surface antigen CD53-like isoform X2 [Babylonia areolata]
MVVDKDSGKFIDDNLSGAGEDGGGGQPPVLINFSSVTDSQVFDTLAYVLIGLGAVIVLITGLAFVGAVKQSMRLLIASFCFQLLIFIGLVATGLLLYFKRDELEVDEDRLVPLLREDLLHAVWSYHTDEQSKKFMDRVQKQLKCCGAYNGGGDYAPALSLPCEDIYTNKPCLPPYKYYVMDNIGVKSFFSGKMTTGAGVVIGIAVFLIASMILTFMLVVSAARAE